jgi:hypothetical protein
MYRPACLCYCICSISSVGEIFTATTITTVAAGGVGGGSSELDGN